MKSFNYGGGKQPINECHLDEIFPRGLNHCVLVIKDVYSRILATEPVDKRDEENVKPFLQRIKDLGLLFRVFLTFGCKTYFNAIRAVFDQKIAIQYDYFHIILAGLATSLEMGGHSQT